MELVLAQLTGLATDVESVSIESDDVDLARARRIALERLRAQSRPPTGEGEGRVRAIRIWSLAHGLATLMLHGRIVTALGGAGTGLETSADFVALAYDAEFSER